MIKEMILKAEKGYPFGVDDFFQQVTGSAILTAPFLFTEEVWEVAAAASDVQALASVLVTLFLGNGILYVSKLERDWDSERKVFGVTLRYISLMLVSFGTVAFLLTITAAEHVFADSWYHMMKVVALISIFSVIGAATADNLI
ncbi:DUF2391 family protein [Candidatus Nanohalovita haloferacivicina]|uniref:DUF2391 family protein n=1 Tax=Candidatus Nanohalovita haloferacivicina TaxID=2978046 RepID=UPI00325F9610|nr:putative membrane protein [Candidatus Nanohalobia archaeon BNXNv]